MSEPIANEIPSAPWFDPQDFDDPAAALARVQEIYQAGTRYLADSLRQFAARPPGQRAMQRIRACYPSVSVRTSTVARADSRLAFGFVAGSGLYETSLTRPDVFARYYLEQFRLLKASHGVQIRIGLSDEPIPLHFALGPEDRVEATLDPEQLKQIRDVFDLPDLEAMDDGIANGTVETPVDAPAPLALFTAPRVDYSLHRLRHYTGTAPQHFQNFVLFTNYQFYVDEFIKLGARAMVDDNNDEQAYESFVMPNGQVFNRGDVVIVDALERLPQMPAYHLVRPDGRGITMVNIGVGPSNAKTITDHIAVLRPHAWVMLGHCAGLRNTQRLGDYVLAHGYVREDHVLDEELPLWVPIPPLAEIQRALENAVADVTRLSGYELKRIMRTGTVASVDNRNWELLPENSAVRRLSQSRAIALDMESATIAANGFRFRVPYGTLLCVSDKPLHGELKLPGMANQFYRDSVNQHLAIGVKAVENLRELGQVRLHSRKLRSFAEVAFQ